MNFTPFTRNMRERIWYWPPASNDGFGGLIFGEAEERLCRWQARVSLVHDTQGREVASSAIAYVNLPVLPEGMFLRGQEDYPDSQPPKTARRIIITGESPSLDQTRALYKVWVE